MACALFHICGAFVLCSIVGALCKKGDDVTNLIIDMIKITRHRGPDGVGICIGSESTYAESPEKLDLSETRGNIGIGAASLAIDINNKERQPLKGCKDCFIVLDGEIYNYQDLAHNLTHHKIMTAADTEIVLHVFEDLLKKSDPTKLKDGHNDGFYYVSQPALGLWMLEEENL